MSTQNNLVNYSDSESEKEERASIYHYTSKNHRGFSVKISELFAVTVPHTIVSKQQAFDNLELICRKLVVAEEKHYNGDLHHHLYLRTNEKMNLCNIKHIVCLAYNINNNEQEQKKTKFSKDCVYIEGYVHCSTVRNEKQYLAYITKEDLNPVHKGVTDRCFSFAFRSTEWANNTKTFAIDKYVLSNANNHKLLRELHNQQENNKKACVKVVPTVYDRSLSLESPCLPKNENVAWVQEVISWWNDWITNGPTRKKKQLYLFGGSNMGKSNLIHHLLYSCIKYDENIPGTEHYDQYSYERQIYQPIPSEPKYAWQGYDSNMFSLVLIDEFDIERFDPSDFKKAIAGESLVSNVKGKNEKILRITKPTIIISNLTPPSEVQSSKYVGIRERLHIVHANVKIYDDLN